VEEEEDRRRGDAGVFVETTGFFPFVTSLFRGEKRGLAITFASSPFCPVEFEVREGREEKMQKQNLSPSPFLSLSSPFFAVKIEKIGEFG
jgi:hypothetical protein